MGYYSSFEIYAVPPATPTDYSFDERDFREKFHAITDYELNSDFTITHVKWYSHNEHMIMLSKFWPDHIFEVYRIGEDEGDMYKNYYRDGLVQSERAEIQFLPFDESKLK